MIEGVLWSIPVAIVLSGLVSIVWSSNILQDANNRSKEALSEIRKATSDDERQAAILKASRTVFVASFGLLLVVASVGLIAVAPSLLLDMTLHVQWVYFASLSVLTSVWFIAFARRGDRTAATETEHTYSWLEKLLHRVALGSTAIRRASFDLECAKYLGQPPYGNDSPVYVTGLARSGTTLLLEILAASPDFRVQVYRDMPFILAPNLWASLARHQQRDVDLQERAHGDGVLVDVDSPEAFEEVFWETFRHRKSPKGYFDNPVEAETLALFAKFRSVVANPKGQQSQRRYLSKNNNSLLRLNELARETSATILLPYREPVAAALSLYRMHQNFKSRHLHDPFALRYMKWLAHHEFGPGHLPFQFAKSHMDSDLTVDQPDYWLSYWLAVHLYVLSIPTSPFILVSYERMCEEPDATCNAVFKRVAAKPEPERLPRIKPLRPTNPQDVDMFSVDLLSRAIQTHGVLLSHHKNIV
jgi:hypothetical protein